MKASGGAEDAIWHIATSGNIEGKVGAVDPGFEGDRSHGRCSFSSIFPTDFVASGNLPFEKPCQILYVGKRGGSKPMSRARI